MVDILISELKDKKFIVKVCTGCSAFNHRDRKRCRTCKNMDFRQLNDHEERYLHDPEFQKSYTVI